MLVGMMYNSETSTRFNKHCEKQILTTATKGGGGPDCGSKAAMEVAKEKKKNKHHQIIILLKILWLGSCIRDLRIPFTGTNLNVLVVETYCINMKRRKNIYNQF